MLLVELKQMIKDEHRGSHSQELSNEIRERLTGKKVVNDGFNSPFDQKADIEANPEMKKFINSDDNMDYTSEMPSRDLLTDRNTATENLFNLRTLNPLELSQVVNEIQI